MRLFCSSLRQRGKATRSITQRVFYLITFPRVFIVLLLASAFLLIDVFSFFYFFFKLEKKKEMLRINGGKNYGTTFLTKLHISFIYPCNSVTMRMVYFLKRRRCKFFLVFPVLTSFI